jgi:hypothetical protein
VSLLRSNAIDGMVFAQKSVDTGSILNDNNIKDMLAEEN